VHPGLSPPRCLWCTLGSAPQTLHHAPDSTLERHCRAPWAQPRETLRCPWLRPPIKGCGTPALAPPKCSDVLQAQPHKNTAVDPKKLALDPKNAAVCPGSAPRMRGYTQNPLAEVFDSGLAPRRFPSPACPGKPGGGCRQGQGGCRGRGYSGERGALASCLFTSPFPKPGVGSSSWGADPILGGVVVVGILGRLPGGVGGSN